MAVSLLSTLQDAAAFVNGVTAQGPKVAAEIAALINKINEAIGLANTNETGVSTNASGLASEVATRTAETAGLAAGVAANIASVGTLTATTDDHETRITDNETAIAAMQSGAMTGCLGGTNYDFAGDAAYYLNYDIIYFGLVYTDYSVTLDIPSGVFPEGKTFRFVNVNNVGYTQLVFAANSCVSGNTSSRTIRLALGDEVVATVVKRDLYPSLLWSVQVFRRTDVDQVTVEIINGQSYTTPVYIPFTKFHAATGVTATVTLPQLLPGMNGIRFVFSKVGTGTLTVEGYGSELVGASTSAALTGTATKIYEAVIPTGTAAGLSKWLTVVSVSE